MSRTLLAFLSIAVAATNARAQANIPSDTIVRLAVQPERYPGQPAVILLDDMSYSVEPDGRWVYRARRVWQVLNQNGVRPTAEQLFSYLPDRHRFTITHTRVLKPTGEVVSEKPAQEQDGAPTASLNNPVYQNQRTKRISLAGVAPGSIVDIGLTMELVTPPREGDFLFQRAFQEGVHLLNARFAVDFPEKYEPRIVEQHLRSGRSEEIDNGRRRIWWNASNVAPRRNQFEPDSNGVTMYVAVGSRASWNDITRWYDGLARDRYSLTADDAKRADSIVRAANPRSRTDTIRALHRWTTQDIRYISIALGLGGYQPRTPAEVLKTSAGDCKDKATLFIAALRRYRIPVAPVILSSSGRADSRLPGVGQFDHVIAAVGDGRARVYTDLTANWVPYGELPSTYQGSFAVVVKPDGSAEEVRIPVTPTDSNMSVVRMNVVLDTSGTLRGTVVEETRGAPSHRNREIFAQNDSVLRASLLRSREQAIFPSGARADSLTMFDVRDLYAPAVLSYRVSVPNMLRTVGTNRVLNLPPFIRGSAASFGQRAANLESTLPRDAMIDASRILGMLVTVTDVSITLPQGWTAELPKNIRATSFFGSYESTWSQENNTVRLVRRIQGVRGIFPSQRITEVITWFKTVATDNYDFLVLRPSASN